MAERDTESTGSADPRPELAVLLRRLLDMVEAGELEAHGWQGEAIRQRLEGAVTVLEQIGP